MPSRSDGYLPDMLLAARSIQDFSSGQTRESFAVDRSRIRAIEREFEILGRAAGNVDEMTRQQFPGLDFRAIGPSSPGAQPIQGVAQRLDIESHGIAQLALGSGRGEEHVVGWTRMARR
jgi:hypothetical protein